MNEFKNKIKSQRGASITFALLLFLVCSMVSIAVVVAGTTAAGRMSQRAETDQRYYAVTSAVELLCDDFKGKTVVVEYSKALTDATVPTTAINVYEDIVDENGSTINPSNCGILVAASKCLVDKIANNRTVTGADDTLTLEMTGAPTGAAVNCTIKEYVKRDGRVIFEVSNTVDPSATQKQVYTLQAVFDANIAQSTSQYSESGTTKEKVTTTLEWSLNSIKKGAIPVS